MGKTFEHPLSVHDRAGMDSLRNLLAARSGELTRASYDHLLELIPAAPGVAYRPDSLDGLPGVWCIPSELASDRVLLYLHGGAYVLGSAHAYRNFVGQLAERAGLAAFVLDYRLAPEHPFPAAHEDALRAYKALSQSKRVGLVGDSAGGGLALSVLSQIERSAARGQSVRAFASVVFSPWTDLTLTAGSMTNRASEDPVLTSATLARAAGQYLDGHDARDPRASPHFDDAPLGPVQVHVGSAEILLDDATRLVNRAKVELHIWDGLVHVFQRNLRLLAAASEALDLAADFLCAHGSEIG